MMSGDGLKTLDTEWWWNYVERIMSLIIIMGVKIRDINAATLYLSHASNNDANNWAIIHIMEAHRFTTTYFAGYTKWSVAREQWISHAANGQLTSLVVYTISVSMFCSETVTDFVVWDREEKSDEPQRYPQLKCIQVMWYQSISVFKPSVQSYTVIRRSQTQTPLTRVKVSSIQWEYWPKSDVCMEQHTLVTTPRFNGVEPSSPCECRHAVISHARISHADLSHSTYKTLEALSEWIKGVKC